MTKTKNAGTKQKILITAEELFAKKGYGNTGIEEISKKAGITKSVIYYHFKNKEDILNTILQQALKDIIDYKQNKSRDIKQNPNDMIDEMLKVLMNYWSSHKDTAKILLMESLKDDNNIPLLSFWEESMGVSNSKVKEEYKVNNDSKGDIMLTFFFMLFIPTLCYSTFEDSWCEHNYTDKSDTKKKLEKTLSQTCKFLLERMINELDD